MQQYESIKRLTGCAIAATTFTLSGCGAWQATKDSTVDAAQWVFTTQVKTMNIDLDARAALNETTAGQALSTVVRLYQLKDANTFARLEYTQLQHSDLELLKADLVATKDVVMRPGSSASVSEPMDRDAQYVGVVAFFRSPSSDGVWKLLIPKKQWKDTDPVKVHVQGNLLAFDGAKDKAIKHDAPQQSTTTPKAPAGGDASTKTAAGTDSTPVNPDAALGNSAESPGATGASASAGMPKASPNASSAADTLKSAKSGANALAQGAAGLIPH
jgi:type VI secretion system protein VasD